MAGNVAQLGLPRCPVFLEWHSFKKFFHSQIAFGYIAFYAGTNPVSSIATTSAYWKHMIYGKLLKFHELAAIKAMSMLVIVQSLPEL